MCLRRQGAVVFVVDVFGLCDGGGWQARERGERVMCEMI